MNYTEIIIHWNKKQEVASFEEIVELVAKDQEGLYQIYGDSQIYGRDVLLYIGRSNNIRKRIKGHLKGVFRQVNNLSVSIGEIKGFNGKLKIPESILIANHKPSFNKDYLHEVSSEAEKKKYIVINNGHSLMLKTTCSNYWWVKSSNPPSEGEKPKV